MRLTARELELLAVLRVIALAAGPGAARVVVGRSDLVALLAAVDRLAQSVRVESLVLIQQPAGSSVVAGTAHVTVHDNSRLYVRGSAE